MGIFDCQAQTLHDQWYQNAMIQHPADSPSFSIHTAQPNPRTISPSAVQPSSLTNPSPAAFRGNIELVFQAESTEIEIAVSKHDLNVADGADELVFTIFDAFEEPIVTHIVPDDGNVSNNFVFIAKQNERFAVTLPNTGLYTLRTTVSRDVHYDIAVSSQKSALVSTLEFIDGSKTFDLYFQAPPGQVELNLSTTHFAGLTQTLRVHDSNNQVVERLFINELTTVFTMMIDVPPEEEGKVWRLHIQKQDIVVQSPQVRYWFRSPNEVFDIEFNERLLQLRVLEMSGIPGMRLPFRFEMNNTRSAPVEVIPVFQYQSGFELDIESHPASITIDGAAKHIEFFYAAIPEHALLGDESVYLLTLNDPNGNAIVSSKITVDVVEQKPLDPAKQFLFFTPEQIAAIREKGQNGKPYQQSIHNGLIQTADRITAERLPVPIEEAFWSGTYICDGIGDGDDDFNDGTGAPLIFDPLRPGVYICSLDGERYEGERYRQGWLGHYHFEICNRMRTLGYAYHISPKPAYANYLRELLLGYADQYRSFPLDDYLGNRSIRAARLMTETLGESICLTQMLQAYDAVRASEQFSHADRAHIEWNFIRPAMEIIRRNPMDITNWQSWHNTAIGLSGFLLDDDDLVNEALFGVNGHEFIKNIAIRDDGIWQEGSVGYHFFGMAAMNVLLEAMDAHGLEPFDEKIELAYSSILDIMQPDGMFPSLNDSGADFVQFRAPHYEIANAHFDHPVFDEILTFIYETRGFGRGVVEALFFGKEYEPSTLHIDSVLKDRMGISLLRSGNTISDQLAMIDYGPHGQFHGHFDKLHLSLFGAGEDWLPDLGTGTVNSPLHAGWFRTTIGHNTIMVGERPQNIDTETERPIRFFHDTFQTMQIMQAEFGAPVYPDGSNIRRTVISNHDLYTIVIDEIENAPPPHDIIFHTQGFLSSSAGFQPGNGAPSWSSSSSGYQFLQPLRFFDNLPDTFNASANSMMTLSATQPVTIKTTKDYHFGDRFETINDWSGNINLSNDATEGETSLAWVVVPREFQSIQKSFDLIKQHRTPTRISFDYKMESNTFDSFILQLTRQPDFPGSNYIITSGEDVTPNEWQHAEIDLTNPDWVSGNNLQFNQIQFAITNANQPDGAFKIYMDNMQDFSGEQRDITFHLAGDGETEYFLTEGPSPLPPRTHPVIIARKNGVRDSRNITVITNSIDQVLNNTGKRITPSIINNNSLFIEIQDVELPRTETLQLVFDTEQNQYSQEYNDPFGESTSTSLVGHQNYSGHFDYQTELPSSFHLLHQRVGKIQYSYTKTDAASDSLTLKNIESFVERVSVSGEIQDDFNVQMNDTGRYDITLFDLPAGSHRIDFTFAPPSTSIQSWELY